MRVGASGKNVRLLNAILEVGETPGFVQGLP